MKKKERRSFLTAVTDVFMLLVLVGHLLVFKNYYFDIFQVKYRYYYTCVIGMLVLFVGYGLVTRKPLKYLQNLHGKKLSEIFNWTDCMVLAFVLFASIATILSPFKYEAFWGNEGRYTGLFLILLYAASYFCVTRYYQIEEWHMDAFLVSGMILCLLGIADYFNWDPLGFEERMLDGQQHIFTSTVGNINTFTACVAMVMAVAGVRLASCKGVVKNIWLGICTFVAFAALIIGESDNAYLSLAVFFGFLPLYLFRTRQGVRKYFLLLAMFFSMIWCVGITQVVFAGYVQPIYSLFQVIAGFSGLPFVVAGMWAVVAVLYVIDFRQHRQDEDASPWLTRIWWGVIALVCLIIAFVLYDVNIAGHVDRYDGLQNYLYFNDEWGTRRGFAWRLAVEDYMNFPILQKIFGYGPDTFSLVAYFHNLEEMFVRYESRYDSVHNEYLQYLITVGPMGLLSYLGIFVASTIDVVKNKLRNPAAMGALFAVLCYAFQATININQPIATPIMWTLLCVAMAKCRETDRG